MPPMTMLTGSRGAGAGTDAMVPSGGLGSVMPSPVPNITTISPRFAGLVLELGVPSWLRAAIGPVPEESDVKIAGAVSATPRSTGAEVLPVYSIVKLTESLPLTEYGTMTLACELLV